MQHKDTWSPNSVRSPLPISCTTSQRPYMRRGRAWAAPTISVEKQLLRLSWALLLPPGQLSTTPGKGWA